MTNTRVCLYTRISTDEENQPTSLHTQRERLEAFCNAQEEWSIVAHHEDQSTGAKLDRPGLQSALDLARRHEIDLLLVYRVDRLSRKVRQLAQLAEELDTLAVVLRSATEPFDTGSAAGRMMLQMLAVFAEFEHYAASGVMLVMPRRLLCRLDGRRGAFGLLRRGGGRGGVGIIAAA